MRKNIIIISLIAAVLFAGYLFFFTDIFKIAPKRIITDSVNTEMIYTQGDSSLPPQYHKVQTWTINSDKEGVLTGTYKLENYTDTLKEEKINISKEQFGEIITISEKINPKVKEYSSPGCTGGNNLALKLSQEGKVLVDVKDYVCGKRNYEGLEEFSKEFRQILNIPD